MSEFDAVEPFVESLEDLCVDHDMTIVDAMEGLTFVLANIMSQMSNGDYKAGVVASVSEALDHCYKLHCGFDESANITIQ